MPYYYLCFIFSHYRFLLFLTSDYKIFHSTLMISVTAHICVCKNKFWDLMCMRVRKMLTERRTHEKALNKGTTRGGRPVLIDRSIFIRKPLNYSTSSLSFSFSEFSVHRVVFTSPLSSMPESLIIPKPSPSINHRRFSSRHRRPLLFTSYSPHRYDYNSKNFRGNKSEDFCSKF